MTDQCLVADLGGLPMIDDNVRASTVSTLACAVRQRLDEKRQPLTAYMRPEVARECYRTVLSRQPTKELASVDPSEDDLGEIRQTCEEICNTVPQWASYFAVQLRWRRLTVDLLSSSNPFIPQHIFLGSRSFASSRLAETIVHEVSHTWVGMIAEVSPIALPSDPVNTLPSGTANKDIGQVIYALTFAATAVRFYRTRIAAGRHMSQDTDRLEYLEKYTDGCLHIAESSDKLLPNGALMAQSCRRFLYS